MDEALHSPGPSHRRALRLRAGLPAIAVLLLAAACGGHSAAAPATTTTSPYAGIQHPKAPPGQTLNLPPVTAGRLAACDADFQTIKAAESSWQLLNGSFATISQLVSGQYLRGPSVYYTGIRIGTPAGGYTLVADPTGPCASLPVAG